MTRTEITETPIHFTVVAEQQAENKCCNGDPSPGDNCIKAEFTNLLKVKRKKSFGYRYNLVCNHLGIWLYGWMDEKMDDRFPI